ncbi:MAG: DHHW family protein [Lachnospiraceae bacterium]
MFLKYKDKILSIILFSFFILLFVAQILLPDKTYSESERRFLAKAPDFRAEELSSGLLMDSCEPYVLDQFPMRDTFRSIKAVFEKYVLCKMDQHEIYEAEGHLSKMVYPMNETMLNHASERFENLYQTYLQPNSWNPYFVIVPDKNYYLADSSHHLSLSYDELYAYMQAKNSYMKWIDIRDRLYVDDYYQTDTHWKQENLVEIADYIVYELTGEHKSTSHSSNQIYASEELKRPFYGVYYGQSALPHKPDKIRFLTNETLENCIVTYTDGQNNTIASLYDMEKAMGKDPYELFLAGTMPIISIDNPSGESGRTLLMFRDSFGSSLAPLMVSYYDKIILVDIRYISSDLLGNYISFDKLSKENTDVLFLYSTLLLNDSMSLK